MKKLPKQPRKQKAGGKKKYKVRNWREYNQALVDRGKIFFWITEEAIKNWENQEKTGKRGKPQQYSNTAIETALTLQQVFHMPLRSCEGFVGSILLKLGTSLKSLDHSTLSIRGKTLSIKIRVRPITHEVLHIVADSTGVKVYGEGEWKVRQHGWSKRRTWKKLHIGVDEESGDILLGEVTGNNTADCELLKPLCLTSFPKNNPLIRCLQTGHTTSGFVTRRSDKEAFLISRYRPSIMQRFGSTGIREQNGWFGMRICGVFGRLAESSGRLSAITIAEACLKQQCFVSKPSLATAYLRVPLRISERNYSSGAWH